MIRFEQTFMNFLLQHQEKYNRTYHFLILMDAMISAAKHIQHYYLTGALKGNLGLAGEVNVQGEDVMRMDQIAQEITIHYLKTSGRVIHAVSEESEEIIPINPDGGAILSISTPWMVHRMSPTGCRLVFYSGLPSGIWKALRTAICGLERIISPPACL